MLPTITMALSKIIGMAPPTDKIRCELKLFDFA